MVLFQFCGRKEGYLAEIVSKIQHTNLNAILDVNSCYWIGLSDIVAENEFVWQHSYSPMGANFTNWVPGEPDNAMHEACVDEDCVQMDEDCVHLWHVGGHWGWNDVVCETSKVGARAPLCHALCQS